MAYSWSGLLSVFYGILLFCPKDGTGFQSQRSVDRGGATRISNFVSHCTSAQVLLPRETSFY